MKSDTDVGRELGRFSSSTLEKVAAELGVPRLGYLKPNGRFARYTRKKMVNLLTKFGTATEGRRQSLEGVIERAKSGELTGEPAALAMEPVVLDESAREEFNELKDIVNRVEKMLDGLRPKVVKVVGTKVQRKVAGVLPEEFDRILQLASQRLHVLLVGPSGCGKTFIAGKVAEALDLPFASISCSAGMSESQVAGWLLPTGKDGSFEYRPTPFVDAYENGGVFLFDEIDSADPNMMTFVNAALANGHMNIPQRLEEPRVERHPDFVCLAAANTWGHGADAQYVGRNQLDAATLDRFAVGKVFMDYSPRVEEAIIDPEVLQWGRGIREAIRDHGLRRIMSTRTMIGISKMKAAYGWKATKWDEQYYADWSKDERRVVKGN